MKIIKRFFVSLFLIIIVLFAIGFALPHHVIGERSIVMNATPDKIFPFVNNQKNNEQDRRGWGVIRM